METDSSVVVTNVNKTVHPVNLEGGKGSDKYLKKKASIPILLNTDFKKVELDEKLTTFINLGHSFLKLNDFIIDFNEDGCVTSCFLNDVIIHEGAPNHVVVLPNDTSLEKCSKACLNNINSTSSQIKLEIFSKKETLQQYSKATVLLQESLNTSFQDAFLDLCSSLNDLRLVIFNTDDDSKELLLKVNTILSLRNFYAHVSGKYTVYVRNIKPEKLIKLNKTPKSSHLIIAILFLFFIVFVFMALKQYFLG